MFLLMTSINSSLAQNLNISDVKESVELQKNLAKIKILSESKWIYKFEALHKKIINKMKIKNRRELELDQEFKRDLIQAHEINTKANSILESK